MYDLSRFIDLPDIREYNRNTYFTPAEWAVLIGISCRRTMEEKTEALNYLLNHFDEEAFREESRNIGPRTSPGHITLPSREMVAKTVQLWQELLEDRYNSDGFLYAAKYSEKTEEESDDLSDYKIFSRYEESYVHLKREKQVYSEDEDLSNVERTGRIYRIMLDEKGHYCENGDCYIFDTDLRLIDILPSAERDSLYENGRCLPLLNEYEYQVYVPLPLREGDIVKAGIIMSHSLSWRDFP